jgi:hypothetical protein
MLFDVQAVPFDTSWRSFWINQGCHAQPLLQMMVHALLTPSTESCPGSRSLCIKGNCKMPKHVARAKLLCLAEFTVICLGMMLIPS